MINVFILTNGKKVSNFNGMSPIIFEDNIVVPGVSLDKARRLKIDTIEKVMDVITGDIELEYELSRAVRNEMDSIMDAWGFGKVDIVFCPKEMIEAIRQGKYTKILPLEFLKKSPFRYPLIIDKTKNIASIHKQCI